MPVVTFDYGDFKTLLGHDIPKKKLLERLPMIGADIDNVKGDTISIEFFPNRPDLTSVEGIVRASRAFFGFQPGMTQYSTSSSSIETVIDPSVKRVRPYIATALVRNVTMSDALIKSLMELQEKLHGGIGRGRKKLAIGVHNFEAVIPPFTYKAVDPAASSFIPLGHTDQMTLKEILSHHEKGKDYAHLLDDKKYPLLVDSHENVLSFPPIINGVLTEVSPYTTELFIDVTGLDEQAIHYALNILTTALVERGGILHTTKVIQGKKHQVYPNLSPTKQSLSVAAVNKLLGTQCTAQEIIKCLQTMGYDASEKTKDTLQVLIPPWRADILHEVDLIEDVAIGYGYDKFTTDMPKDLTIGTPLPHHKLTGVLRTSLIGLGFQEVNTFVISNPREEFDHLGIEKQSCVELLNPIGEEYSILRLNLLPSLLKILRENRHHPLPQQFFELGTVIENYKNTLHVAAVKIDAKTHFTECKSLVEAVLRNLGIPLTIETSNHPAFITGRQATILHKKTPIGVFGEIHPQTITAFSLEHPMIGFELNLQPLLDTMS